MSDYNSYNDAYHHKLRKTTIFNNYIPGVIYISPIKNQTPNILSFESNIPILVNKEVTYEGDVTAFARYFHTDRKGVRGIYYVTQETYIQQTTKKKDINNVGVPFTFVLYVGARTEINEKTMIKFLEENLNNIKNYTPKELETEITQKEDAIYQNIYHHSNKNSPEYGSVMHLYNAHDKNFNILYESYNSKNNVINAYDIISHSPKELFSSMIPDIWGATEYVLDQNPFTHQKRETPLTEQFDFVFANNIKIHNLTLLKDSDLSSDSTIVELENNQNIKSFITPHLKYANNYNDMLKTETTPHERVLFSADATIGGKKSTLIIGGTFVPQEL